MAKVSDFKIGMQLGLDKAHHKTPPRRKSGHQPELGDILIILAFFFNIFATAEASDIKFSMLLRFEKAHHKITPR